MGQQFLFVYLPCLVLCFQDYDVVLQADERLEKWSRDLGTARWLQCVCQQDTTNAQNTQTCLLDDALSRGRSGECGR